MKSIMIDIETLATTPDAAVLSIGIVAFSQDGGVLASDGWAIRSEDWHGTVDGQTAKWWMDQNEAAREYSFKGTHSDLHAAQGLANFAKLWGGDETWANDPDFDIVILRKWWARLQTVKAFTLPSFPFHYRTMRSQRTIMAEARRLGVGFEHVYTPSSVAHNPIDDAAQQARVVTYIRNQITAAA